MLDFVVTGLPRSATTWLAVLLTTDRSLCLHDPFSLGWPDKWERDGRRFGISCTGIYLMPEILGRQDCPVAIIERDPDDCRASLDLMGFKDAQVDKLKAMLDRAEGLRFRFDDLWSEEKIQELWAFLVPGLPFDKLRYRQLAQMQIQPHMRKWRPDANVLADLQRSY
jgi:hypothetical protein